MAKLSFTSSAVRFIPDILGNRDDEAPFELQVKRMSSAELAAFRLEADELRQRLMGGVTGEEVKALLGPFLSGPVGELIIDGETITSLDPIYELAAKDPPLLGCIFDGLAQAVILSNSIAETMAKNSERRRGGDGGTPDTATAATLPPSAAETAVSRSSAIATSSDPTDEGGSESSSTPAPTVSPPTKRSPASS